MLSLTKKIFGILIVSLLLITPSFGVISPCPKNTVSLEISNKDLKDCSNIKATSLTIKNSSIVGSNVRSLSMEILNSDISTSNITGVGVRIASNSAVKASVIKGTDVCIQLGTNLAGSTLKADVTNITEKQFEAAGGRQSEVTFWKVASACGAFNQ